MTARAAMHKSGIFARYARAVAVAAGHPLAFAAAAAIVAGWGALGPLFGFSDTWQLVINTGTSIATFLMVFLIQNTQNRDQQALQIKIDELLRVTKGAHYALIDLEELSDQEIAQIRRQYVRLAREGRERLRSGGGDTGTPPMNAGQFGEAPAAGR